MNRTPTPWAKYMERRGVHGPWLLEGDAAGPFSGAVVIPALAESETLFATLQSLAGNPAVNLERWQVVVVVNHGEGCRAELAGDNLATLKRLRSDAPPGRLRLAWVDAASPGLELPDRQAGVGMARKIGFDLALCCLDPVRRPLLVALDADTLVDQNYLPAIEAHFEAANAGGAVLPFWHRREGPPRLRQAIETYELYLRAYPLGLKAAGSPYAYPTIGSAMACTAEAYVRAGGMNRRVAGEDFYFLQQLARTAGVEQLRGTVVSPSARISERTPFGTGPSMVRLLGGEQSVVAFYHPQVFRILGLWLRLATSNARAGLSELMDAAGAIHPKLADFLVEAGFEAAWPRLQTNGRGAVDADAFHGWFDALKTFRLIRCLSQGELAPGSPQEMVTALLPHVPWGIEPGVSDLNSRLFAFCHEPDPKGVV